MSFDTVIVLDWSGGRATGPKPRKDAIWAAVGRAGRVEDPLYFRSRQEAEAWTMRLLDAELAAGRRAALSLDICFAYPEGFATRLTGSEDPFALWDWFADRVTDGPDGRNNRFDLAGEINAMFPGTGPFWGNGTKTDVTHLPRKGRAREGHGLPEKRAADAAAKGAFSPWQLSGAGAVGGQVIMALPMLSRLRTRYGKDLGVWPWQDASRPITLIETYLTLLPKALQAEPHAIRDAAQVALFARLLSGLGDGDWSRLLDVDPVPGGWVLGLGHEEWLTARALGPPPLSNDCFALPPGAHWTPVDQALDRLRDAMRPVTGARQVPLAEAGGLRLARDVVARRAHPPAANSAVDGYGFAGPLAEGDHSLPLVPGRSAAGAPYPGVVPEGQAIRILTGAILPDGVDTVVLQEDVTASRDAIRLRGPLKRGANTRRAGEDMAAGQTILSAGRRLTPADLATAAAAGVADVTAFAPLRVGVLSTGDELHEPGEEPPVGGIFDANRPMLLDIIRRWGFDAVDLDRCPDDRDLLRRRLTEAAAQCDAILTSGGASAGEEDHVSAVLKDGSGFALWRVAVKPGRPLAMGMWDGTPVIGLPGNPVAALVCTLIFARPALERLAGGDWTAPQGFTVPAAFAKRKKAGRREYLRARLTVAGQAEVFPSEGSGRVSGLTWATGLVELPDEAMEVAPGTPVRFLPWGSLGL